jgi:hypothetical protein
MSKRSIIDSVRKLSEIKSNLFVVTVTSVDEVKHTCEGQSLTDNAGVDSNTLPSIIGIRLNVNANDSLMIVPAVGKDILVLMTTNKEYYMVAWSDIDKIIIQIDSNISLIGNSSGWIFNDGHNKGLVKLIPLVQDINTQITRINNIVTALTTLAASMTAIGGSPVLGTALGAAITSAISTITTPIPAETQANLEDKKVTH